jgi:hypothetical protein
MSDWKAATVSSLLPAGASTVLSSISASLSTLETAIAIPVTALNIASSLVQTISIDLFSALRAALISFRDSIDLTGMYYCSMLDYPVRQVTSKRGKNYDSDYRVLGSGDAFSTSFLKDLAASMIDSYDPQRPSFNGNCAMLVLVGAAPSIEALGYDYNLDAGWGNLFAGVNQELGYAKRTLRNIRMTFALAVARAKAERESDHRVVAARVKRLTRCVQLYSQLPEHERDQIPTVYDPVSGESLFCYGQSLDEIDYDRINWKQDVEPLITCIEHTYSTLATYPDWKSYTLDEFFPELTAMSHAVFNPLIDLLQAGVGLGDQINRLIASIKKKIDYYKDLIDRIQSVIDSITDILDVTGLYALFVSSNHGTDDLRTKLLAAGNQPFSGLKGYYSGIALLAGAPSVTVFTSLFSPIAI